MFKIFFIVLGYFETSQLVCIEAWWRLTCFSILQWTATQSGSTWIFSTSGVNMGYYKDTPFDENPIIGVTQDTSFGISSAPTNGQDADTLTYIILLYIRNPTIIYSSLFSIESLFQTRACVFSLPFQIRSQESPPLWLNATLAWIYKVGTSWNYKCTFLSSKLYF